MKEIVGDIWDYHEQGYWIVITTNGTIKANGDTVMGRGVALQTKQRFPELPMLLGERIRQKSLHVESFLSRRMLAFPVKYEWRQKANIKLIEKSCVELAQLADAWSSCGIPSTFYMVRPGCGNGRLDWKDVKPILERYLDDRFVVVDKKGEGG